MARAAGGVHHRMYTGFATVGSRSRKDIASTTDLPMWGVGDLVRGDHVGVPGVVPSRCRPHRHRTRRGQDVDAVAVLVHTQHLCHSGFLPRIWPSRSMANGTPVPTRV